jgi:general secretion pathway protein A
MYLEFFGLNEAPFNLPPDPRFLYMSQRHREPLASLIYGIKESKGFIVLTGEIGSGKTTLCRAFLHELKHETTNVALILNSYLDDVELLQAINDELGIDSGTRSKKKLIDRLNQFLLDENAKGKTTILIIDEAQNLSTAVLEQIRMLSNLETETSKLIQIALVGQPELNELLNLPRLEQLNQRITVRYHITPLDKTEILSLYPPPPRGGRRQGQHPLHHQALKPHLSPHGRHPAQDQSGCAIARFWRPTWPVSC